MMTSILDSDSLLVVDVGTISTRAMLFDVVDGVYRFLAAGSAPTTADAPFYNIGEGVHQAIDNLQKITGRILIDSEAQLIMPGTVDGSGIDLFAAIISAGGPLKTIVVGLLESVSLESAKRLARTAYSKIVETISLNDRRKPADRIDAIVHLRPDLIIVAGGTEDGASQSVLKLLEVVGLACYVMPETLRPDVLYAGNQSLQEDVADSLNAVAKVHFAPNVRPILEEEQLDAAQMQVAKIYGQVRARQLLGVSELNEWTNNNLLPTSAAFGRIVRFISKSKATGKGVLGVDIGASATTVAAAFDGDLTLGVYPEFGLGVSLADYANHFPVEEIMDWLPLSVHGNYVAEYLQNKALFPGSMPATLEDLAVEQAIARVLLRHAVQNSIPNFPEQATILGENLLPLVEPILLSGSVLTKAPSLVDSVLMVLDGLQPVGVTTLILDQNHLVAALGAAAANNPILAVQVLDSNSILHLGTVISPVGNARPGTPVLRLKITYQSGEVRDYEVKQGALEVLPLPPGQTAQIQLQPLHRYDVGMGAPGRGGVLRRVAGSALGLIVDARGRPIKVPSDPTKRAELIRRWYRVFGGK